MRERGGALWPFLPRISSGRAENPIFQRCWMREAERWQVWGLKFFALDSVSAGFTPPLLLLSGHGPFS